MNSDNQLLEAHHARTLLAEALANPAQRTALLARAMERLDAMPATLKRWKFVVRMRDEIEREMAKQ